MLLTSIKFCIFDYDRTIADVPVDWPAWRPRVKMFLSDLCSPGLFDGRNLRVDEMEFRAVKFLQESGRLNEVSAVFDLRSEAEATATCRHIGHENVIRLVRKLFAQQTRLFICSNNLRDTVLSGLRQLELDSFFGDVVGIDDVWNPKPSPAGLLMLMKRHGLCGQEGCVVGDSDATDGVASRQAGLPYYDVCQLPTDDSQLREERQRESQ